MYKIKKKLKFERQVKNNKLIITKKIQAIYKNMDLYFKNKNEFRYLVFFTKSMKSGKFEKDKFFKN